jgi:four helix bundle protein
MGGLKSDQWRGASDEFMEPTAIKSYKDLLVWQKGVNLVKMVYQVTKEFPSDERFGLMSQMRRAAISVPSNIAEGQSRRTTGEFVQSISHAEGSLAELETQLLISIDLGFVKSQQTKGILSQIEELQKMLNSLRHKLSNRFSPLAPRH